MRKKIPLTRGRLAELLRAAAEAHHSAERRLPKHDWADWYAAYVCKRKQGFDERYAIASADALIAFKLSAEGGEGDA